MKIPNPLAKNPFEEFADEHSLVYSARFEEDAHTVVRGVTLSNARKDQYLVQGHIEGYDVQLLQRQISLHKPGSQMMVYKWAILQITLPTSANLPHVFLDGNNRYHEDIYDAIFTKFHKLILAPAPYQNSFTANYRIFANPETISVLTKFIPAKATYKLSSFGYQMDYELFENGIYVYLPEGVEEAAELNQMYSAACLLAIK